MTLAFDQEHGDFSGITGTKKPPVYISQILHKAFIDLNEAGTEAGAATVVVPHLGRALEMGSVAEFKIDHPFDYVIADNKTDAILFMGRVTDPRN